MREKEEGKMGGRRGGEKGRMGRWEEDERRRGEGGEWEEDERRRGEGGE